MGLQGRPIILSQLVYLMNPSIAGLFESTVRSRQLDGRLELNRQWSQVSVLHIWHLRKASTIYGRLLSPPLLRVVVCEKARLLDPSHARNAADLARLSESDGTSIAPRRILLNALEAIQHLAREERRGAGRSRRVEGTHAHLAGQRQSRDEAEQRRRAGNTDGRAGRESGGCGVSVVSLPLTSLN